MNIIDPKTLKTNYTDPHMAEIMEKIIGPEVEREKAGYMQRQLKWAKENYDRGSQWQEAMGQKIGSIDLATFVRWQQEVPGCWDDPDFVKRFLAANPECAAPTLTRRA